MMSGMLPLALLCLVGVMTLHLFVRFTALLAYMQIDRVDEMLASLKGSQQKTVCDSDRSCSMDGAVNDNSED